MAEKEIIKKGEITLTGAVSAGYFAILVFSIFAGLEFFLTIFIFLAATIPFYLPRQNIYRLPLISFSVLFLFHLIIFPWIYVLVLRNNIDSFKINDSIVNNQIQQIKAQVNDDFEPRKLASDIALMERLLKSNQPFLYKTKSSFEDDNYIRVDSLIIYNDKFLEGGFSTLHVLNINKTRPSNILTPHSIDSEESIRSYFQNILINLRERQSNFKNESTLINEKQIWSYHRLLPYSINIYNSGNFSPITPLANILICIHQWLVGIFVVGLITSQIFSNKKQNAIS